MTVNRRRPFLVTNTTSKAISVVVCLFAFFETVTLQKFTFSRPISFYLLVHYFKASSKLRMLVHVTRNSW